MSEFAPTSTLLDALRLASPFASGIYDKDPSTAHAFLTPLWQKALNRDDMNELMHQFVGVGELSQDDLYQLDEIKVAKGLRVLRKYLMLKWIWQDALGSIRLEQLTLELSLFADACICFSKDYVYQCLLQKYGIPKATWEGRHVLDEFAVIAMGKLGAKELNLSSDIDLIFIHLGIGDTDNTQLGKKSIDTQKFMTNLGRGVIRLLGDVSEHGFVFRVDMRLRPWGDGSPLVMTLPALQKYFSQHGRTWERFAWLKARVVTPVSEPFYQALMNVRQTFVHRYYVDYTAFSALREMKTMIVNQQAQRQDLDNVKLGMGGIRDVEFIVQSFSLIYGGHHASIGDARACLNSIRVLKEFNYLSDDEAYDLEHAYRFLRRLEHAIQARHDEQTQKLPSDENELNDLAKTLGFANIKEFYQCLNTHRQKVRTPFDKMVTDRQNMPQTAVSGDDVYEQLQGLLPSESMALLDEFWSSRLVTGLDDEPKSRLQTAYPILLQALLSHVQTAGVERASMALPRLIDLLEAICRRSIYLVMIAENPNATQELVPMLSASPWIAKELALHPMLLDNFLQKRFLNLPDKAGLADALRQSVLRVEPFDDESYLAAIRVFKKTQVLAVATADVLGLRHIMKVSDSLTFTAEVVLESALQRAFTELTQKHGYPKLQSGRWASADHSGFAIIGYGKLGGLEMSYASDLDVVFLHNIDEKADTDGEKSVSGMKFASRMVQKIISYLTTQTRDGRAYELDMRLRPSGNAGVMIVSVNAFGLYQEQKAWAWEHQALVRARGITGDADVLSQFDDIRKQILTKQRDKEQVRLDVLHMRQKMQSHLGTQDKDAHQFNIKQDFGGLVDIEFLAQFMVLAYASDYHELAIWSDNVRIFETVAQTKLWSKQWCEKLTETYLLLRQKTHELALSDKKIIVDDMAWQESRAFVRDVWGQVVGEL